ncbi:MAG: hypothetical protein Q7S88_00855 [Candidatus Daviesbacteria bacterium]|nr:hypothetical protein [Candidatus Daviesbacteria bacterium]
MADQDKEMVGTQVLTEQEATHPLEGTVVVARPQVEPPEKEVKVVSPAPETSTPKVSRRSFAAFLGVLGAAITLGPAIVTEVDKLLGRKAEPDK